MMNKLLLALLILTIASCQKKDKSSHEFHRGYVYGGHTVDDPLPNEALTFEVNLHYVNFSSEQQQKMEGAIAIIKQIVASEEFRERILNHRYNNELTFVDNNGYSNAQIYEIILQASEQLYPQENNTMDAEVELYFDAGNVVGYTYPNTPRIWVNTKYFTSYTLASVARNLFHEWMHKLGFNHASTWSASRDFSVPYAIGTIVSDLGKQYL